MMSFETVRRRGPATPEQVLADFRRDLALLPPAEVATAIAFLPERIEVPDLPELTADERKALPLAGVPFLVKDLYDVAGWPTTASSAFLADERGIPEHTASLVRRLWDLGAIPVGKTHLNEFAYGLSGRNVHSGDCPHPCFPDRIPGGSSSGSAWGVGKGLVPLALGTDTGGSVRVPAALCGLWGLRLTPAAGWLEGCFPLSPSMDTAGWFTLTPGDLAVTIRLLLESPVRAEEAPPLKGLWLESPQPVTDRFLRSACEQVREALGLAGESVAEAGLRELGAGLVEHYAVLQSREAFEVHRSWLDRLKDRYGPAVWARIDRGRHWSPARVEAAERARAGIADFFRDLFERWDFVALPAVPSTAPLARDLDDGFRSRALALTAPASLAALPVLTLPVPLPDGLSGGLQLIFPEGRWEVPLHLLEVLS
jgi:aspartyl-tRNA(Asn)/glutamyl-tRNA(Gln) amidotransferase subunit A